MELGIPEPKSLKYTSMVSKFFCELFQLIWIGLEVSKNIRTRIKSPDERDGDFQNFPEMPKHPWTKRQRIYLSKT